MKNRITYQLGRTVLASLSAAALMLAACSEEEFTRSIGSMPDDNAIKGISAELYRPAAMGGIIRLVEEDATDQLRVRLSQPASAAVTVTVAADAELCDAYNKEHGTDFTIFPVEKVSFGTGNGAVTVEAGKKESADLTITFRREGVEKGRYLLPVRATVAGETVSAPEKQQICYYRILVYQPTPATEFIPIDLNFKVVAYVNTAEINPLMCTEFLTEKYDFWDFEAEPVVSHWIDFVALRKAAIVRHASSERAMLKLGTDLEYILSNREQYIEPLQKSGRKVLICIQGGNTGLGFCNMTDQQIDDFVYQLKAVVERFDLDGVNFFDTEAGYDKEGAPAVIAASYPKLLKAVKEALGDKLVTVACDQTSTEILAVEQDGISAGAYIDYAWNGIFDTIIDAYAPDARLKPIVGMAKNTYGGAFFRIVGDREADAKGEVWRPQVKALYDAGSANVIAFYDLLSAQAGRENGPRKCFLYYVLFVFSDLDLEGDGISYDSRMVTSWKWTAPNGDVTQYGKYEKDW